MKTCISGTPCPETGESICCKGCDKLSDCQSACTDAFDQARICPNELDLTESAVDTETDVETDLALFERKESNLINAVSFLFKQKEALEKQEKLLRSKLASAMDTYGIKSFENDSLKLTYIPPTTRNSLDSTRLKKEMPEIAEKYNKVSKVSASVKITMK